MEKKTSNNLAVCIICGILTAFGLVTSAVSLVNGGNGGWMLSDAVYIVVSVLVGYYAICGYKKPHGNLLKYIILIFAASCLIALYTTVELEMGWMAVQFAIIIGLCCYAAGRLHRVKQNAILMGLVAVITLIRTIAVIAIGDASIGVCTVLILWLDICVAYFLRFKVHKEAGLEDAPKAK